MWSCESWSCYPPPQSRSARFVGYAQRFSVIWQTVRQLLGPGLQWAKTQEELETAIRTAEQLGQPAAADHIRIILERRNRVCWGVNLPR